LSAGAATARGQAPAPVSLDPNIAGEGTSLVLGVDAPAAPLAISMPRGSRFDRAAAARGAAIGFGRYVEDVQGFLAPGAGSTQLVWSLVAALGKPVHKRDLASVVLTGRLLGADSVSALVQPLLGVPIPATTTTTARLVRSGGRIQLRIGSLPAQIAPAPPATATPSRLELSLSAVRRVRETFFHRVRVPTSTGGVRIRRIRDHRLVGHNLLTAPASCRGSWTYKLRSGGQTSSGPAPCTRPLALG
jgi:hypothetical protein